MKKRQLTLARPPLLSKMQSEHSTEYAGAASDSVGEQEVMFNEISANFKHE